MSRTTPRLSREISNPRQMTLHNAPMPKGVRNAIVGVVYEILRD